jgi:hypothetical protein
MTSPVMMSLRAAGVRFLRGQNGYLPTLARRLGTDPYTLKRWWHTGGPDNLAERRDKLLRDLMRERLKDSLDAATMLARDQKQASIYDRDRANRLLDFWNQMYPPAPMYEDGVSTQPDMAAPPKTIDELCEGAPPLVAAQLRDILEGVD